MDTIINKVKLEIQKLVPKGILNELTCFVFYDNHPRGEKNIDVTVCTEAGSIIEYYKQEVMHSMHLGCKSKANSIKILRNINCELYYLVLAVDEVLLISSYKGMHLHRRIVNALDYTIEDNACRGYPTLKVSCRNDPVPLVFNENFESLGDSAMVYCAISVDNTTKILTQLMRKLTEARYSVMYNEKTLYELMSLRQLSALSSFQKIQPNAEDTIFKNTKEKENNAVIDIKSKKPLVRMCNKKIVVILTFSYNFDEPIEDIHILLHGTSKASIIYTTRLFERIDTVPFWREKNYRIIKNEHNIAITAVINRSEIKDITTTKIEFSGAIAYKKSGDEYVIPFDNVIICGIDLLSPEYDCITSNDLDRITCLTILASTSRNEMIMRHIRKKEEKIQNIPELLCNHMQMEFIKGTTNALIFKDRYHLLRGAMLIFEKRETNPDVYDVLIYTKASQISSLVFTIQLNVPRQIILTTKHQKITAINEDFAKYNELANTSKNINFDEYASSLSEQCSIILEYLDECMIAMASSKDAEVKTKVGNEIDLFAPGVEKYMEFKTKVLKEAIKGIKCFNQTKSLCLKMEVD